MRLTLAILASLLLLAFDVHAQDASRDEALRQLTDASVQVRRDAIARLGDVGTMADVTPLLKALRDRDEEVRNDAEQAIWRIWARSGDAEVDALYRTGIRQMESGDLEAAIATFTRIIEMKPEFAEGWNKRATLYFMAGDLRRSLADCDEVIKRNPQHFGALSGYAQIYVQLEYYDRALTYARRALAVNPNLDGVRRYIEVLEHLVEQRKRQTI